MKKLSVFLLAALILLVGCQSGLNTVSPQPSSFVGNYVVDIDYIKENIGNDNFLAVDVRGEEAALKGTLEGAIGVVWQQFATVTDGKSGDAMWGVVMPADKLSEALSATGMTKDKDIVLFADTTSAWGDDGRMLWMLVMAGYENVKILDGGIGAILASDLPTVNGVIPYQAKMVAIDNIDYSTSIDTDELMARMNANPNIKIIDTRDKSEYDGATKFGEAKGGHLPSAVNIDFMQVLEGGYLKSNDDIVKLLTDNGIGKSDEIVTYCTAGIRSAYMQKILEMNGYTNVRNYDESYYRWANVNDVEK